mgnify:CR=1 FL=1|jgi:hypothetical protein|tara:strand:- start:6413 stop:7576 length:1164 start_codon:yes stop_codon:yes gene_type:complete
MSFNIQDHKEVTQVTTYEDTSLGIMRWGMSNSFPKTLENLIKQSPSAYPAVKRTAKFYKGAGFTGEDEIVNQNGLTLKKVVAILADDYSLYGAFALQCNFNIKEQVTSINPLRIADLRFSVFDELNFASEIGYYYNFGGNSEIKKTIDLTATRGKIKWFNRFNPKSVLKQIENKEGGISNYLGQILYHSDEGFSSYPIPPLQPAINYVLSDIENSILVRKETSTGFINSYLLKTSLDSEDPTLIAIQDAIEEAQGARGTGKVVTFSGLAPEDLQATLLEEIGGGAGARSGIIGSAKTAYELDKDVINAAYLIPPALAGIDQSSGFSGKDLEEAYFVYNAITQNARDTIESELNRVLENSIFNTKSISIKKLKLDLEEVEETGAKNKI